MMYNILEYSHKKIVPKSLNNFKDSDFRKQVVLNFRGEVFSEYNMNMFYKHIRNINLCLNKLAKQFKASTFESLKNSVTFLYLNYLESFIDSILGHYFHTTSKDPEKQKILDKIIKDIFNEGCLDG